MRIKRTDVAVREQFVFELFSGNPDLSVAKANAEVKIKFGRMMRPARMYDLRRTATNPRDTALVSNPAL